MGRPALTRKTAQALRARLRIPFWLLVTKHPTKTSPQIDGVPTCFRDIELLRPEIESETASLEPKLAASPQTENGFTKIANEILEALSRTNLSKYQVRLLWAIFRKTYGYQKKSDWISNSQFVEMTGIRKSHVSRAIKELCQRNILIREGVKVGFQKDYTSWTELQKKLPNEVTVTSTGNSKKLPIKVSELPSEVSQLPLQGHTKETSTKETSTKETHVQDSAKKKPYSRGNGSGKQPEIPYDEIINYLNKKTGQHYRAASKDTREHIAARFEDGATLEEFKRAIDNMTMMWLNDPKMSPYLRPATLFAKGKFDGYVNQIKPQIASPAGTGAIARLHAEEERIKKERETTNAGTHIYTTEQP
jgi:phage replication O-like protein O